VARGLLTLADQAQVEEGRVEPDRRASDQRDRERALEWLVATAEHRGIEWIPPAPVAQEGTSIRSRVPPEEPGRERKPDTVLPEVGSVWKDEDGVPFLVREVGLARTFGKGRRAWVVLRMSGGIPKRMSVVEWTRMARRCEFVKGPEDA
jgi:hypothetical protein